MDLNIEYLETEIKNKNDMYIKANNLEAQFREAKTKIVGQIEYLQELLKLVKEQTKTPNG